MSKGVPNKRYTPEFRKTVAETMPDKAFARIPDGTNVMLRSDRGWQYQHKQYQRLAMKASMSSMVRGMETVRFSQPFSVTRQLSSSLKPMPHGS